MKILIDHNLSPRLAAALNAFFVEDGFNFYSLREKFSVDATDEEIFVKWRAAGGDLLISGDIRITKNRLQKKAFKESGLIGLFFNRTVLALAPNKQAAIIINLWEDIIQELKAAQIGTIFIMGPNGRIEIKE